MNLVNGKENVHFYWSDVIYVSASAAALVFIILVVMLRYMGLLPKWSDS
jgi:hypothetical protein